MDGGRVAVVRRLPLSEPGGRYGRRKRARRRRTPAISDDGERSRLGGRAVLAGERQPLDPTGLRRRDRRRDAGRRASHPGWESGSVSLGGPGHAGPLRLSDQRPVDLVSRRKLRRDLRPSGERGRGSGERRISSPGRVLSIQQEVAVRATPRDDRRRHGRSDRVGARPSDAKTGSATRTAFPGRGHRRRRGAGGQGSRSAVFRGRRPTDPVPATHETPGRRRPPSTLSRLPRRPAAPSDPERPGMGLRSSQLLGPVGSSGEPVRSDAARAPPPDRRTSKKNEKIGDARPRSDWRRVLFALFLVFDRQDPRAPSRISRSGRAPTPVVGSKRRSTVDAAIGRGTFTYLTHLKIRRLRATRFVLAAARRPPCRRRREEGGATTRAKGPWSYAPGRDVVIAINRWIRPL